MNKDITRNMFSKIRDIITENNKMASPEEYSASKKLLKEENEGNDSNHKQKVSITKSSSQFGDIYQGQTEAIRKTVSSSVKFPENALLYYPGANDMTLNFSVPHLNIECQFRLNDASGSGCFVTTKDFSMNDENNRTLLKIFDAYKNWKDSIDEQGDLFERLEKVTKK